VTGVRTVRIEEAGWAGAAHRAAIVSLPAHWRLAGPGEPAEVLVTDAPVDWASRPEPVVVLAHDAEPASDPPPGGPRPVVAPPLPVRWPDVMHERERRAPVIVDSRVTFRASAGLRGALIAQLASLRGAVGPPDSLRVTSLSDRHYVLAGSIGTTALNLVATLDDDAPEIIIDVVGLGSRRHLRARTAAPAQPVEARLHTGAGVFHAAPVHESHLRAFWRTLHAGGRPAYDIEDWRADRRLSAATLG
jgi:hypothetical protein